MNVRKRNWKIFRLRGILPQVINLIPTDIAERLPHNTLLNLNTAIQDITKVINERKRKNFTCALCSDISTLKITKNKKAFTCDICNNYAEKLYLIKDPYAANTNNSQ